MSTARPRNEGVQGTAEKTAGIMRGVWWKQGLLGSVFKEVRLELLQRQVRGVTKDGFGVGDVCRYVCSYMGMYDVGLVSCL